MAGWPIFDNWRLTLNRLRYGRNSHTKSGCVEVMFKLGVKAQLSVITLGMLTCIAGCFGGPGRIEAPEWNVDTITDNCMTQVDANGDGFVTKKEAEENAPGLAYALQQIDADSDKKLSRDEIWQRFQDYADSKVGMQGFGFSVLYKGRPLRRGDLKLVPEPFMADYIQEADGEITDEYTGGVEFDISGDDLFGVNPGMYRIEVRSDDVNIKPKYNDETVLGVEVAPFTNEFEPVGGLKIKLK